MDKAGVDGMNHKRGKPKSKRAGCLLCKPHKAEFVRKIPRSKRAKMTLTEPVSAELW